MSPVWARFQWSRMRRLPETILFSRQAPSGMSILSPWLAMMIDPVYVEKRLISPLLKQAHTLVWRLCEVTTPVIQLIICWTLHTLTRHPRRDALPPVSKSRFRLSSSNWLNSCSICECWDSVSLASARTSSFVSWMYSCVRSWSQKYSTIIDSGGWGTVPHNRVKACGSGDSKIVIRFIYSCTLHYMSTATEEGGWLPKRLANK